MLKTIRPQQSDGLQYTPVSGRYRCKPMYIGSPTRARTWDLRINSPSLYQLSYRGNVIAAKPRPSLPFYIFSLPRVNAAPRRERA